MLIKFLPDQVAAHWEEFKVAIERSAPVSPGESVNKFNNILESILVGEMVCWISVNSEKKMDIIITTMVHVDDFAETKSLMVYSATGYGPVNIRSWGEAIKTLRDYGRSIGCGRLIAFSSNDFISKIAQRYGGDSDFKLVDIPI